MKRLLLALVACGSPPAPTSVPHPASTDLAPVAFMEGRWVGVEPSGARTEEQWMVPSGSTMIGMSRTVENGKTVFFEYIRIEAKDGKIVYLASPLGRDPPTPFTLTSSGPNRATFENPQHDYPKKILYTREGTSMHARIEGDGKSSEWIWMRE